jgi:D-3-phosphoglycerate dehydrogenase / 2-oxoglutarate reductase
VAELTLGLILDVARRVSELDRRARSGEKVARSKFLGKSMHGRTIGIIGMGNIGTFVAKKWIGAMVSKSQSLDQDGMKTNAYQ